MSLEERASVIRERMRHDIANTLRQYMGTGAVITGELLDALVDDGMFPVEHLLVELATIVQETSV
jgi:hypothetical protein